jgi:C-terminal processing protease CtpA/Prc
LEGNVGYVEIRSFAYSARAIADAVAKEMSAVADADALIIDIRRNGGGAPEAVSLISSYLFGEQPVHLNSLYFRPDNTTEDFYTLRSVAGKRFGPDKPVYVLTSKATFSAAEEFAYNLQSRKRATIVGETSGGGAHPGGTQQVGEGFWVFVPAGRAINPITRTNWEGVGVIPEVPVPADSALTTALRLARARKPRP